MDWLYKFYQVCARFTVPNMLDTISIYYAVLSADADHRSSMHIYHPPSDDGILHVDQCHPENNTLESNKVVYIRLLSKYVKCISYYNSPGVG